MYQQTIKAPDESNDRKCQAHAAACVVEEKMSASTTIA
jgi:hypothetical protein